MWLLFYRLLSSLEYTFDGESAVGDVNDKAAASTHANDVSFLTCFVNDYLLHSSLFSLCFSLCIFIFSSLNLDTSSQYYSHIEEICLYHQPTFLAF